MENQKEKEIKMDSIKEKKFNIVYKTTNNINGRYYIGIHSTNSINDSYLGSGKALKSAIKKYGRKNFKKEVLFKFNSRQEALEKEAELVNKDLISTDECYNMIEGGGDCPYFSGDKHPNYGKSRPKRLNNLHSIRMKKMYKEGKIRKDKENHHFYGKSLSNTHKESLSKSFSGEKNPFYGKKHSEESKKTMGAAHPDVDFSGSNNPSSKKVIHRKTGKIFSCAKEAAKWSGINYKTFMNRIYKDAKCNEFDYYNE